MVDAVEVNDYISDLKIRAAYIRGKKVNKCNVFNTSGASDIIGIHKMVPSVIIYFLITHVTRFIVCHIRKFSFTRQLLKQLRMK